MNSKNFVDEFNLSIKKEEYHNISDYDKFKNKELLDLLRSKIIQNLIDDNINSQKDVEKFIKEKIDLTLNGYDLTLEQRSYIYNLIDNEVSGFGPITELLKDKTITEIMVNGKNEVYIEIDGKIEKDDSVSFINDNHIIRTIQRLIQPLGRTIDTSNPMVDARLTDGSRLNAVIPPLSLKGPVLTIRKFKQDLANIDDFLRSGALTNDMAKFLEACVKAKLNIIICGGTGGGKTTLLNVLSSFISDNERIITIEDAAELKLHQNHVISLETRLTNYEGAGEVTIRDLVINSLRMRPDRIIVGEVRGKEAFDMLQAMNTGHSGSLSTMHDNSCSDALNRLETLVLMAVEIPVSAIREYIVNAINIVVNISRLSDGKRKVTSICEVDGFDGEDIKLNEIFSFEQEGVMANKEVTGAFKTTNVKPKVMSKIEAKGINLDIFK